MIGPRRYSGAEAWHDRVSRPPLQPPLRGPGLPFTSPLSRADVLDDGGRRAGRRIYLRKHEKKQQKAVGAGSLSHGGTGRSARAYTLLPATPGRCCGGTSYRTHEACTRRTAFALLEGLSAQRGSHRTHHGSGVLAFGAAFGDAPIHRVGRAGVVMGWWGEQRRTRRI
ncbi:hypothetical protein TcCL_Unassigned01783 [Trypanosoma cruzi]|nr:hypothetical protein TcCL_Unassigned01783 [Trypanosoma cruzi]